jgi:predicted PurR-regulated permease PerM
MADISPASSKFSTLFFLILFVLSAVLTIHLLFGFLTPIVLALVTVSLCFPAYRRLCRALNGRNYLAACLATTGVFLCILIPLSFFFFLLTQEILSFYDATAQGGHSGDFSTLLASLKTYLDSLQKYLQGFGINIAPGKILDMAGSLVQDLGRFFYDNISWLAANLISLLFNFVLMLALVFVFFVSGSATQAFLVDLVPLPKKEIDRLAHKFQELASAVFLGNGVISLAEGIVGGLLFYFFGLPGALVWGVVIAVVSFLPVVGGWVVIVPAAIYLFLVERTGAAIAFFILNGLSLGVMEMIIKPKLVGTKSQMHAALVFLSVFAGIQIYGAFGLFYGPLVVTMFLSLAEIYKEHYRDHLLKKTKEHS